MTDVGHRSVATRLGTAAGVAALGPLVALGSADHADAAKIRITNTHADGKGSFERAARQADRSANKDTLLFVSSLSGSIDTQGVEFRHPVALVSKSRHASLRGKGNAKLEFRAKNTQAHPGPANSIRGLQIRGLSVHVGTYSGMHISDAVLRGGAARPEFGLYANYSDATVKRSTITGFGTGVRNFGSDVVVEDTLLRKNDIGVNSSYDNTVVRRSTITGSREYGVRAGYEGDDDVHDSTIAHNGVGVFASVEVYDSTVTGNGSAVESYYGDTATFQNSIVIGNTPRAGGAECGKGHPKSMGGNVFGKRSNCGAGARATDAIVKDARLGPLADNGGPTPTISLGKRSPAIGQAVPKTASKRDQRGVKRDKHPDSGAFERRPGD